jgi:hypothetical protein
MKPSNKLLSLGLGAAAMLLLGCADNKAIEIRRALKLSKDKPCYLTAFKVFPYKTEDVFKLRSDPTLEPLLKLGLLKKTPVKVKDRSISSSMVKMNLARLSSGPEHYTSVWLYELTELGEKYYEVEDRGWAGGQITRFCF